VSAGEVSSVCSDKKYCISSFGIQFGITVT
jgi:hypothetical protein